MSEASFRLSLRSAVRGLWEGAITKSQFKSAMTKALQKELTIAWAEGVKECGVSSDELTDDETDALTKFITNQFGYIDGFADAIKEADNDDSKTIFPLFERAKLWQNRYSDARNQAKVMACENKKLMWIIGPTESHCPDCAGYNGKTYRASIWGDIRPQHPNLNCHGFRCRCSFQVTTKRANRGKPPGMTG